VFAVFVEIRTDYRNCVNVRKFYLRWIGLSPMLAEGWPLENSLREFGRSTPAGLGVPEQG